MQTVLQERDDYSAAHKSPRPACRFEAIMTGGILGRIGSLEVRLARDDAEIAAVQEVRFRVFYDELGARRDALHSLEERDSDRFDALCDHLLVVDTALPGPDHRRIVGTYRLLRQEIAAKAGGFYSNDEFELEQLVARHPGQQFLELGRSCVLKEYRSKRTIEILWQGIFAYINRYSIGVMTGCASFHGTEPAAHAEALSYLAHYCRTEPQWDVRAVADRYCTMDLMAREAINTKAAIAALPPLIKGYLRLGATIGDGAVIDHQFGTTDVLIILPVSALNARYIGHFGASADRHAA